MPSMPEPVRREGQCTGRGDTVQDGVSRARRDAYRWAVAIASIEVKKLE